MRQQFKLLPPSCIKIGNNSPKMKRWTPNLLSQVRACRDPLKDAVSEVNRTTPDLGRRTKSH